jgi:hypothetical protein
MSRAFRVWFDDHELRLVPLDDYEIIVFDNDNDADGPDRAIEIAEGEAWSSESEFYSALQAEGIKFEVNP